MSSELDISPDAGGEADPRTPASPLVQRTPWSAHWRALQSQASSGIEGHIPSNEYLTDCEDYIAGRKTLDDVRAASLSRALAPNTAPTAPTESTAGP